MIFVELTDLLIKDLVKVVLAEVFRSLLRRSLLDNRLLLLISLFDNFSDLANFSLTRLMKNARLLNLRFLKANLCICHFCLRFSDLTRISLVLIYKDSRNRTHTYDFEDHCSTIKLYP